MPKPPTPSPPGAQGRRAPRRPARPAAPAPGGPQRLPKLLARAGVASRRDIERMIGEGRVALGGAVLSLPAPLVTDLRGITVDGRPVASPEAARVFRLNKPPGVLTTARDPAGRPTVHGLIPPDFPRLLTVGRLDWSSEGLLLLTNDGGLKRTLELPATGLERRYRARAYGPATQQLLDRLLDGLTIEGVRYGPIRAFLESKRGDNAWIELILTEGKNREVRRVLEFLGLKVNRLIRTHYGPFALGDLPTARVEEVPSPDVAALVQRFPLRIIAGEWRGRLLEAPPGQTTRPTSARAREALFSMLDARLGGSGGRGFEGRRVLDLFAGSGALGLEALSRGAASARFVERLAGARAAIARNIAHLGAGAATEIIAADVERLGAAPAAHDLVFVDPPYHMGLARAALALLADRGWLAPDAWIAVETAVDEELAGGAAEVDRAHGRARLRLFHRA